MTAGSYTVEQLLSAGEKAVAQGQADNAFKYFKEAVRQHPSSTQALARLGLFALQQHKFDLAATACRRAVELDPKDVDATRNLGVAYLHLKDHNKALEAFLQALKITRKSPELFYYTGATYELLAELPMAKSAYNEALKLEPEYALVHLRLAKIAMRRKNYGEAKRGFERVLKIDPTSTEAQDGLQKTKAAQQESADANPFGRLVNSDTLRQPEVSDAYFMSDVIRMGDRQVVRAYASEIQNSAQAYHEFLEEDLLNVLHRVSQALAGGNSYELANLWHELREALERTAETHKTHRAKARALAQHEENIPQTLVD